MLNNILTLIALLCAIVKVAGNIDCSHHKYVGWPSKCIACVRTTLALAYFTSVEQILWLIAVKSRD